MSQRSKNLLEAFNQSRAPEKSAQPVATPKGSTPRVGGPFADAAGAPRARAEVRTEPVVARAEPRPRESRPTAELTSRAGVGLPAARWRVAILCVAVATIFFVLGRASVSRAAGPADPGVQTPEVDSSVSNTPAPAKPEPATANASTGVTPQAALLDKRNKFTVLAATYIYSDAKSRESRREMASAACTHLQQQGLPVALYDHPTRKQYLLLVGAATTFSDLDALLARVRNTPSARGQLEFQTALSVPIDNYVER